MAQNWTNRTLWTGDNLDVLRGMNSGSVDLIYLDPPFNSNRDYAAPIGSEAAGAAFKDTWTLSDVDEAWHGEIADREPALYAIVQAAELAHGKSMKSYLIMMAVRLLELRRVLKATGSIYLHCDDTAVHYLKMVMDAVFSVSAHKSHLVWKRSPANNSGRNFGRIADHILYYASDKFVWNQQYVPISEAESKEYRYKDPDGRRYKGENLTETTRQSSRMFTWRGATPKHGWRYSRERLEELYAEGRIHLKRDGTPSLRGRKVYLDEHPGSKVQNIWTDIARVGNTGHERVGYPTQKPLALLERIIKASSNEGDMVLDPFAGCATACVAAERLGRQWVGIDLSPLAAKLVKARLEREWRMFYQIHHRHDIPQRTDLGKLPSYRTHKHTLYGKQEGLCNGCLTMFPFRNMTVDHVIPQAKGGSDHLDNLQLLCGACNSTKGTGSQEELIAKLRAQGIRFNAMAIVKP